MATIQQISDDPSLSPFLSEDFDPISYVGAQVKVGTVQACLEKLTGGADLLDHEIHGKVIEKHDELFKQVGTVRDLRGTLASVSAGAVKLHSATKRLQSQLNDPFEKFNAHLRQLERIQDACDTLRKVHRVLSLTAKLRGFIKTAEGKMERIDLAPAAKIVSELDALIAGNIGNVDAVDAEKAFIAQSLTEIVSSANVILNQGMKSQSLSDIATAVQTFFNLGRLSERITAILAAEAKTVKTATKSALDITTIRQESSAISHGPGGIQRTGAPRAGQGEHWRTVLFERLTVMFQAMHDSVFRIWLVQRILVAKSDPETRTFYIDSLEDETLRQNLALSFWKTILRSISDEFSYAMKAFPFIDQTLVSDFSRVLRLARDMVARLCSVTSLRNVPGIASRSELWESLRSMLSGQLESLYLARSLNKLQQPFLRSFGQGMVPSIQEVKSIISVSKRELNLVKDDEKLSSGIARVVAQACSLFAAKSEEVALVDSDSHASGAPTSSHQFNAELCNSLITLQDELNGIVESLSGDRKSLLVNAANTLSTLVEQIVTPLFNTFERHLERAVSRVHDQLLGIESQRNDLSDAGEILGLPQGEVDGCSVYMAALVGEIGRLRKQHISLFLPCSVIAQKSKKLASYVMLSFIYHCTIVRPLGSEGRAMLARDTTVLESCVSALWYNIPDKNLISMIRALRTLLFMETSQISESIDVQLASLPLSCVLNHLFSRGPAELKSVHALRDWSPSQYVRWMIGRSEQDRLKVIGSALDSYATNVDRRGGVQYHSLYVAMKSLLK